MQPAIPCVRGRTSDHLNQFWYWQICSLLERIIQELKVAKLKLVTNYQTDLFFLPNIKNKKPCPLQYLMSFYKKKFMSLGWCFKCTLASCIQDISHQQVMETNHNKRFKSIGWMTILFKTCIVLWNNDLCKP